MTRRILGALLFAAATASCTGNPPVETTPSSTVERPATPVGQLERILATELSRSQDSAYAAFAAEQGTDVQEQGGGVQELLSAVAQDPDADPLARANAVVRMGRIPLPAFDVYAATIEDRDARVRGATLGAAGRLVEQAPERALPILERGLHDAEAAVQAKALQEIGDRDLDLLRGFAAETTNAALRDIAVQQIRQAEAWGARLTPEADGSLRRVSPAGVTLVLRPERRWPNASLVMGTLSATVAGRTRVVADSVEAVAGVIPAVVDATGRWLALETARRIEVHDLETGAVRVAGQGLAPRPLPLTSDFIFFHELRRAPMGPRTAIMYQVVRAPFTGGADPRVIDSVELPLRYEVNGYMSPLRWARIRAGGTGFVLSTDGIRDHVLPSPFDAAPATD